MKVYLLEMKLFLLEIKVYLLEMKVYHLKIKVYLQERKYLYKVVLSVYLSVCLSNHNSGTPEPICLKF